MLRSAQSTTHIDAPIQDTKIVRYRLQREISCLQMQLERLRRRGDILDLVTLQTYEEMISSRREMLDSL